MMKAYLDKGEGKALIPKVNAIFGFNILAKKGGKPERSFTIDLKNGQGDVKAEEAKNADATFTMVD